MENKYLAKSKIGKTIKNHTDDLFRQFEILKKLYPDILNKEEWEILWYAIAYHDIGKMNTKFQNKIYKVLKFEKLLEDYSDEDEISHNFLSPFFIDVPYFINKYGKSYTEILISSVYYHHVREEKESDFKNVKDDLRNQLKSFGKFYNLDLKISDVYPKRFILKTSYIDDIEVLESKRYILIKGLLNKIDYVASIDKEQINVEESVYNEDGKTVAELIKTRYSKSYRPVQEYMLENKDNNIIVISPTGSGKTEAALLWAENSKLFYTLPLKVSINAIYERIVKNINYSKALLLHSDAYTYYMNNSNIKEDNSDILYERARRLSSPLIVTTVDQIFKVVFKYCGYEEILATLAYSKVLIDEIQMYSPQLLAYILLGLKMITNMGGKFAIVTATFPPVLYNLMDKLEISYKKQEKAFSSHLKNRHKIKVLRNQDMDISKIKELGKNKKVLVIVNTVRKAQILYDELYGENTYLLHSNYTKEDRALLESAILKFGNKEFKESGIWISTQIVEASLDIDFDVLFTDMCTIDSLFQRMGRVYRKREYNLEEPNIYIYDNKNGVKGKTPIIDPEIYEYSLEEILKYDDLNISEEDKQDMINNIFDIQKNKELISSKYYRKINETIDLFKETLPNEKRKKEIDLLFRDIQSISLMPDEIYDELYNENVIETWNNAMSAKADFTEKSIIKEEISKKVITVTNRRSLERDIKELFYEGSNIYRTKYKYEFNKDTLKGKGLVTWELKNDSYFDE